MKLASLTFSAISLILFFTSSALAAQRYITIKNETSDITVSDIAYQPAYAGTGERLAEKINLPIKPASFGKAKLVMEGDANFDGTLVIGKENVSTPICAIGVYINNSYTPRTYVAFNYLLPHYRCKVLDQTSPNPVVTIKLNERHNLK